MWLKSLAWVREPLKIQKGPADFTVTQDGKFSDTVPDAASRLTFTSRARVTFCTLRRQLPSSGKAAQLLPPGLALSERSRISFTHFSPDNVSQAIGGGEERPSACLLRSRTFSGKQRDAFGQMFFVLKNIIISDTLFTFT